jgi:DNA processing protein
VTALDARAVSAAVLAWMPGMTPARLGAVLDAWPDPIDALARIRAGRRDVGELVGDAPLAAVWRTAVDDAAVADALARRGTRVLVVDDDAYPIADALPDRPRVLFVEGARLDVFDHPRVAVVGTRAATPHGLADAEQLGAFLARHAVTVVSGLAIGVDAAAHVGALDAGGGVIGVVATGVDIVYPRRHAVLHERVRSAGVLVTEHRLGVPPAARRFPVRNRIIAGLADAVVVVEATARGGARITAEHAIEYARPVLAVPGSRRNPAAAGCNALLADGAIPLLDPTDVLVALGLTAGSRRGWDAVAPGGPARVPRDPACTALFRVLAGEPATIDELVTRSGLDPPVVAAALSRLARAGAVRHDRGLVWPC